MSNASFEPLISIVTVAFNSARTLEQTIRSVEAQTYPHREYIVIDGGSTDGTAQILERHARVIDKVVSEEDRGIYDAMNKGWQAARGHFVHFLNSDDWFCDPRCLENLVAAMNARGLPTSDIAAAVWHGRIRYEERDGSIIPLGHAVSPAELRFNLVGIHQPGMLTPRPLFAQVGGFDLTYRVAADYDFIRRVVRSAPLHFVEIDLVHLSWGGASHHQAVRAIQENMQIARKFGESWVAVQRRWLRDLLHWSARKWFPRATHALERLKALTVRR